MFTGKRAVFSLSVFALGTASLLGTLNATGTGGLLAQTSSQDNAQCVSVYAPTSVKAGARFTGTVAVRNKGKTTWSKTVYRLGSSPANDTTWGLSSASLRNNVYPNGMVYIPISATAPTTAGNYSFAWQMLKSPSTQFGPVCSKTVKVTGGSFSSSSMKSSSSSSSVGRPLGDVSGDGAVTSYDASLVLAHVNGTTPLSTGALPYADADQNGIVDIADPYLIGGKATGMISLPAVFGDMTGNGTVSSQDTAMVMASIAGTQTLTTQQKFLADVNVDTVVDQKDVDLIGKAATGQSRLPVPSGYVCAGQSGQQWMCRSLGDVSGDGAITSYDASLVLAHVKGTTPLSGAKLPYADADQNGIVDIADPYLIGGKATGMISLPAVFGDMTGNGTVSSQDTAMVMASIAGTQTLTTQQKFLADVNVDTVVDQKDVDLIGKAATGQGTLPVITASSSSSSSSPTICGNGKVEGNEQCDDGNYSANDGCSSICIVESGWSCKGYPSVCATVCGDAIKVGSEECDDGNQTNGDGCSATCKKEVQLPTLNVNVESLSQSGTTVANAKNVTLLRFKAGANAVGPINMTQIIADAQLGSLTNATNYTLWVDSDGDGKVDTKLQEGVNPTVVESSSSSSSSSVNFDACRLDQLDGTNITRNAYTDLEECLSKLCDVYGPANLTHGLESVCVFLGTKIKYYKSSSSSSSSAASHYCKDTDGGKYPGVSGEITTESGRWNDLCVQTSSDERLFVSSCGPYSNCAMIEYACHKTSGSQYEFTCPNGCASGACKIGNSSSFHSSSSHYSSAWAGSTSSCPPMEKPPEGCQLICATQLVDGGCPICSVYCPSSSSHSTSSVPAVCDNGILDPGEQCDPSLITFAPQCGPDGTCSKNCICVSSGHSSAWSGQSSSIAGWVCGDGVITSTEQCDDANKLAGDGCNYNCAVETGWVCQGSPSTCVSVCGDGYITATEQCDDANFVVEDGCDFFCHIESGFRCSGQPSHCNKETSFIFSIRNWIGSLFRFNAEVAPAEPSIPVNPYNPTVVRFDNLVNGGYVIPKETGVAFEIHADIAAAPVSSTLQLKLATTVGGFIKAKDLATGTDILPVCTNATGDACRIVVTTAPSTVWTIINPARNAFNAIDANGDAVITSSEMTSGLMAFGATFGKSTGEAGFNAKYDVDGSGKVDMGDYSFITPLV
ncbi:MAG: DUF4215 domain-containing protein, partial [Candidatus Peribacteraceae bacterium]